MNTTNVKAFGAQVAVEPLKDLTIQRTEVNPKDVEIEILYCDICHSDLHSVHNDWGSTIYPIVPGHEIVERIIKVGER